MTQKRYARSCIDDVVDLNNALRAARDELPAAWLPLIDVEARRAEKRFYMRRASRDKVAELEVWKKWLGEFGGAAGSDLSDSQIKADAKRLARDASDLDLGLLVAAPSGVPEWASGQTGWDEWARLAAFCERHSVEPPSPKMGLEACGMRVRCQYWWRRALRRMVARKCERGALALGIVSKPAGQPYASNSAVFRRVDQNRRNAVGMGQTVMENDNGQRATLLDLAARSVANKAIRRGELMTRIRGCEEVADAAGHKGMFITLTCPSRFHSTLRTGKPNPKHDLSTPRDGQLWLRKQWELARSALHRKGYAVYGFRVAEPHHDGCPHWHMLIWSPVNPWRVARILKRYWLQQTGKFHALEGREPGARKNRTDFKLMEKGGAAGYVAKYVSKNIDDFELSAHVDDYADAPIQPDIFDGQTIKPCHRVEAWASTWGIRQFQPIGQPPVMVWRELRRVPESVARSFGGQHSPLFKAWQAAQKNFGVLASWARYVQAQGGMKRDCRIKLAVEVRNIKGMYEERPVPVPVGVSFVGRVAYSERQLWRRMERDSVPDFSAGTALPRTRVNNCTRHNKLRAGPLVELQMERARRVRRGDEFEPGQGGEVGEIERMAAMIRQFDAKRGGVARRWGPGRGQYEFVPDDG